MALETLAGIEKIDGFNVHRVNWNQPPFNFIEINDEHNAITFKIQDGPIKEFGVNGCQIDTIVATALLMIQGLDKKFPCDENKEAIDGLKHAWESLISRKKNREARGVEGRSIA